MLYSEKIILSHKIGNFNLTNQQTKMKSVLITLKKNHIYPIKDEHLRTVVEFYFVI